MGAAEGGAVVVLIIMMAQASFGYSGWGDAGGVPGGALIPTVAGYGFGLDRVEVAIVAGAVSGGDLLGGSRPPDSPAFRGGTPLLFDTPPAPSPDRSSPPGKAPATMGISTSSRPKQ